MTEHTTTYDTIDSCVSYFIGATAIAFDVVMRNAPTIMTIGGLVLLSLRLYTDAIRAWRTFKNKDL